MPHNHPPRCCCENTIGKQADGTRITDPDQTCTSCVEHGELASLNSAPLQCPEESPSTGLRCLREAGHNGGHNTTDDQPWPGECTSCHAHNGHPHTDYCPRINTPPTHTSQTPTHTR